MTRDEIKEFNSNLEVNDGELEIYEKLNHVVDIVDELRSSLCQTTFFERTSYAFNEPTLSENINCVFEDVYELFQLFEVASSSINYLYSLTHLCSDIVSMYEKLYGSNSILVRLHTITPTHLSNIKYTLED